MPNKPLKISCLTCPYYSTKYNCQALTKICECPAIKIPPRLVLTIADMSKLVDSAVTIDKIDGVDNFNFATIARIFGE